MIAALLLVSLSLAQTAPAAQAAGVRPFPLMVGDAAPKLAPSRWLKGAPVASFASGHTYLVEFWATWCGPCRRSIPHLTELQKRFDSKLTVIGVDVWEPRLEDVEPFVQKQGDGMAYTIAVDDVPAAPADCDNVSRWSAEHGVISNAWLAASGWKEEGIPVAYVVDGKGVLAWAGDPQELDGPLAQIIAGEWKLADQAQVYRTRMDNILRARPIRARLSKAENAHDGKTAVQCIDELLALGGAQFADLAGSKFQTLLLDLDRPDEAYAFAHEALTGVAHDNISALGQIGYVIAFMAKDPIEDELALALAATQRANELAKGERAGVLDTLARIYMLQDKPELAAETEKLALAKSHDAGERKELEGRLKEYEQKLGG